MAFLLMSAFFPIITGTRIAFAIRETNVSVRFRRILQNVLPYASIRMHILSSPFLSDHFDSEDLCEVLEELPVIAVGYDDMLASDLLCKLLYRCCKLYS